MKRIVWLIDDPSWAFGIGYKRIAERLPEFEHVAYTAEQINKDPKLVDEIKSADAVFCPWPVWLHSCERIGNVVAGIKSKRAFQGTKQCRSSEN